MKERLFPYTRETVCQFNADAQKVLAKMEELRSVHPV